MGATPRSAADAQRTNGPPRAPLRPTRVTSGISALLGNHFLSDGAPAGCPLAGAVEHLTSRTDQRLSPPFLSPLAGES